LERRGGVLPNSPTPRFKVSWEKGKGRGGGERKKKEDERLCPFSEETRFEGKRGKRNFEEKKKGSSTLLHSSFLRGEGEDG